MSLSTIARRAAIYAQSLVDQVADMGGQSPALAADKAMYLASVSAGALIATLVDPFGSGSTFTVVGSAPATLALASGGRIVAGAGAQSAGVDSTIVIRASKGKRAVEEPLTFTAKAAAVTPTPSPTPTPTQSPTIAFANATASVTEGDSGTKTVSNVINVTRNGVTGPLTVNLTYGGTATSGTDYVAGPLSGTIADGQSSLSFDLTINGDTGVESDETIVINAVLATYSSVTASKTITVTNDDAAQTLPSVYVGQVANNSRVMDGASNTAIQANSRSAHIATDTVSRIKFVIANWYKKSDSTAESNPGWSQKYTASVEYPAGTFTRVSWNGGATSVTTATTDDQVVSDWTDVAIPEGATFWFRVYMTTTVGWFVMIQEGSGAPGALMPAAVSSFEYGSNFADKTMGGTVGQTSAGRGWFPLAIVGETRKPSVLIVASDSTGRGANDDYDTSKFNHGFIERAIGNKFGIINAAAYGDTVSSFVTSGNSPRRQALKQFVSHVFMNSGNNDVSGGQARATVTNNIKTAATYFSDKRSYRFTLKPRTTVLKSGLSLSASGTTVTATFAAGHNLATGMQVIISGASPSIYNGTYIVTVIDATTFTYTTATAPASTPATGTISFNDQWATTANQTPGVGGAPGGVIDLVNSDQAAGVPGTLGMFDPWASAFDRATNTWKVDGTPAKYTGDGTHSSPFGSLAQADAIRSQVQAISRDGL